MCFQFIHVLTRNIALSWVAFLIKYEKVVKKWVYFWFWFFFKAWCTQFRNPAQKIYVIDYHLIKIMKKFPAWVPPKFDFFLKISTWKTIVKMWTEFFLSSPSRDIACWNFDMARGDNPAGGGCSESNIFFAIYLDHK